LTSTRQLALEWFEEHVRDKAAIFGELGPFPKEELNGWQTRDGPAWVWWVINVLPIPPELKVS
jgi:hypothetical protein